MGAGLQNGLEGVKEGQEQLKIGQGEVLRATCWASRERRLVEVTERVTETCTRHVETREITRRQVTEYTETREITEIGERLHGVEEEGDAHTHIQVARDNGGELAERVGTRCGQLGVLPRERGEYAPLKPVTAR